MDTHRSEGKIIPLDGKEEINQNSLCSANNKVLSNDSWKTECFKEAPISGSQESWDCCYLGNTFQSNRCGHTHQWSPGPSWITLFWQSNSDAWLSSVCLIFTCFFFLMTFKSLSFSNMSFYLELDIFPHKLEYFEIKTSLNLGNTIKKRTDPHCSLDICLSYN